MKLYDNTTENGQNYRNPVLYMDYSDPDVIRVGEDYYMVASSFTYLPGVPLLLLVVAQGPGDDAALELHQLGEDRGTHAGTLRCRTGPVKQKAGR